MPPEMPLVKLPVPVTANPVELKTKYDVPSIEIPNCPVPGLKIPVDDSAEKFNAGDAADPLIKLIAVDPACTVLAL